MLTGEGNLKKYRSYVEKSTGNVVVLQAISADSDTDERVVIYSADCYEWTPKHHRSLERFLREFDEAPRGCDHVAHIMSGPCPRCGG